jgi:transposase InsO family protein
MPWKVSPVHEVRFALVHAVRHLNVTVAAAARQFGVSRRVAYKWLARYDDAPHAPLADRARRPRTSPTRTGDDVEQRVLAVRDRFNWGPRKIHFYLRRHGEAEGVRPEQVPAIRTVADVLRRHGRVAATRRARSDEDPAPARFERSAPNELWQLDFKGPVEVDRAKLMPLAVVDDHSRYCLAYQPCADVTMHSAWGVLWNLFGEVGLPDQVLSDNAFNTMGTPRPAGISWFDACLVRLDIRPSHGRAYHPQTQGKVERFNGTSVRELIEFNARRDCPALFDLDCRRWRGVYNTPCDPTRRSATSRPSPAGAPATARGPRRSPRSVTTWRGVRRSAPSTTPARSASAGGASSVAAASPNRSSASKSAIARWRSSTAGSRSGSCRPVNCIEVQSCDLLPMSLHHVLPISLH